MTIEICIHLLVRENLLELKARKILGFFIAFKTNINNIKIDKICSETQRNIYVKLLELSRTLQSAYNEKTLSYICDYLFEVCSLFNKFYGECNIVNEKDESVKNNYISMLHLVYNTCCKLLDILAIKVPNKM